jgi:hypothetical protein
MLIPEKTNLALQSKKEVAKTTVVDSSSNENLQVVGEFNSHTPQEREKYWFDFLASLCAATNIARGTKTPLNKLKIQSWANLLVSANYTREKASVAWLWCLTGTWYGTRDIQFADLFPTSKNLAELNHGLMAVSLHQNRMKALKEEHQREIHALAVHYERKLSESSGQSMNLVELVDVGNEILKLTDEIQRLNLELEWYRGAYGDYRQRESVPERVTNSAETYSHGSLVPQSATTAHSNTMYHKGLVTQTGVGNDR